jgi:hypothetical protein
MKEGIPALRVIYPLRNPKKAQTVRVMKRAITGGIPALAVFTITIVLKAKTDPTERSNSPEIIKKDAPSATIPTSDASVNIEVVAGTVRKFDDSAENRIPMVSRPAIAPISGVFVNRA